MAHSLPQVRAVHSAHTRANCGLQGARRAALALAIGAVLAAGPAAAIEIANFTWTSNTSDYNLYAATCAQATGNALDTCGSGSVGALPDSSEATNATPDTDAVIYSWGLLNNTNNSTYTWTNDLGYAFRLDSVNLVADGAVGTAPGGNPSLGQNAVGQQQGTGAIAAWELSSTIRDTYVSEMRVQFTGRLGEADAFVWNDGTVTGSTANNQLVTEYTEFGQGTKIPLPDDLTWFPASPDQDDTYQTAIDRTFSVPGSVSDRGIAMSDKVEVRLFEDFQDGGDSSPNAVLSDVQLIVQGAKADLQATGVDFGDVRVGTGPTGPENAVVTNALDADSDGYRALDVNVGAASGTFFSGAATDLGTLAAGGSGNAGFSFDPTVIGAAAIGENIAVTSSDAQGTSFDLTGRGVGPQASGTYKGISYNGDDIDNISIDFGQQAIDAGPTLAQQLTLANLFGEDLGDLTNLTIQLTWGGGFALNLMGNPVIQGQDYVIADSAATAANGRLIAPVFDIVFDPSVVGLYDVDLTISTDQGGAFGATGTTVYNVALMGEGISGGAAPVPGTLALIGLGIAGLRLRRRAAA